MKKACQIIFIRKFWTFQYSISFSFFQNLENFEKNQFCLDALERLKSMKNGLDNI